jgi:mannose-1-phosphate guanylyltransferase/mannose-6-phosphate isomerase
MTLSSLYTLILAGGSGTRLWPLSREELPKQFLNLTNHSSLLQNTVTRSLDFTEPENLFVVAGKSWQALVQHQVRQVTNCSHDCVIQEPCGRNTCPAIALGIRYLMDKKGAESDDVVLICPSDHVIDSPDDLSKAVGSAVGAAKEGYISTFGIVPTGPETGFGYLHAGEINGNGYCELKRFVEKPDLETAKEYVREGNYYWNGGMFVFRIGDMLDALCEHAPEIGEAAKLGYDHLLEVFSDLPSISIDYAVMEKLDKAAMIPLDAGWSDVGSWDAVYDISPKEDNNNSVHGDAILLNSSDNLMFSRERLLVGVDLKEMLVVDTPDALFVAPRGSSQKVKDVVEKLKNMNRKEATEAPESARPWGTYRVLNEGDRYKIKKITIDPGKRLSLQYHHHRTEHWVVVKGTAKVSLDNKEVYVHEGESIFVPKNSTHRLENPGKIPLEIIEVQNGEYTGEDDIVRIEDDYRR